MPMTVHSACAAAPAAPPASPSAALAAIGPAADGVLAGMALDVLEAAVCRVLPGGRLHWHPDSLHGVFGQAGVPVPDALAALDGLLDGAATRSLAGGARMVVDLAGPVAVLADRDRSALVLQRLEPSRARRISQDPEAVALERALADGRMRLYRQPIVAASDGRQVVRWECLARMVRPDGTVAGAAEFIPAAERSGLIGRVDLAALGLALATLARVPTEALAVNVSAATLADAAARDAYLDRLRACHGRVAGLTVEITETIAIQDLDTAARFAEQARAPGVRIALDDFGEGHSSFRSLMHLPLDEVKIDGLYVQDIDARTDSQAFVRAIEGLSRGLGLETVAERVETEAEAAALRRMGIHGLQGHFFGAPAAV